MEGRFIPSLLSGLCPIHSLRKGSSRPEEDKGVVSKYEPGEAQATKANVKYADFNLFGMKFAAMDNGMDVDFNFTEAFSLIVNCKDQEEIDYY